MTEGSHDRIGYALHALPEHTAVPWHRVVNHRGAISTGRASLRRYRRVPAGPLP